MLGLKTEITKYVDMDIPTHCVECRIVDALGKEHIFIEKVPIVTGEHLTEDSEYPQNGHLACEILEERIDNGNKIVKVTTENPWYIESTKGELVFEVYPEQVEIFDYS